MTRVFPEKGIPWADLKAEVLEVQKDDPKWREGRMLMSCYFVDDALMDMTREAYGMFLLENALYSGAQAKARKVGFATITQFEDEIIKMALEILQGPEGAAGNTTTGGTESILCAVKAAVEYAKAECDIPGTPRLLLPFTAHPAFNKAAWMMGLEVTRVPVKADGRADVAAMRAMVDENTILMVGSAPCYPFGVIDPIRDLTEIAAEHGVWFHVDACVGGYQAPFVRKLGYPVPEFEFNIPGVWSMSADLHKNGFAAKGCSTILYRDAALKDYATFRFEDWPYGSYTTATVVGSRTGGALAAAWAVMKYLGEDGYLDAVGTIMEIKNQIVGAADAIDGIYVPCDPDVGLITMRSDEYDIHAVADAMLERGWLMGRGREPRSIHVAVHPIHAKAMNGFLSDLSGAAEAVRSGAFAGSGQEAIYAG
jgi:glutamate/tyrosine decarboxylase-like PLP-dependent enzyme